MRKLIALAAMLALAGCATCEEHPAICGTVVLVAAGAAVAIAHRNNPNTIVIKRSPPVNCSQTPAACQ